MDVDLKLRFILVCNNLYFENSHVHTVGASTSDHAHELREAIKAKCSPTFDNVKADSLHVYAVTGLAEDEIETLYGKLCSQEPLQVREWKAQELNEIRSLGRIFGPQLEADSIHLIVDCTDA
ncbi:hypothetical protein BZG36_05407, partial [Bifiguratus adelaidae]